MSGVVWGVTIEPWVKGVASTAVSVALVMVVVACLGGALYLLCLGAKQLGEEVNQMTVTVIHQFEVTIRDQRAAAVPAFTTFVGTVGIATANLVVSPVVGFSVAVCGAAVTFAFASLAKDRNRGSLLRWLAVIGAMAPFVGLTGAIFASGRFATFSTGLQIVLGAGLLVGVIGLTGILASLREGTSPSSELGA